MFELVDTRNNESSHLGQFASKVGREVKVVFHKHTSFGVNVQQRKLTTEERENLFRTLESPCPSTELKN